MSLTKQQSLDAMRTFARDVAREKGEVDTPAEQAATKEAEKQSNTTKPKKSDSAVLKAVKPPKPRPAPAPKPPAPPKPPKEKEVLKKVEAAKKPKEIPPFHELQKVVKTDIKAETKKAVEKKQPKKKAITPSKPVGGGTVITDNKNDRPSFFAELKRSVNDWFTSLKKTAAPKKNTYAVTKTERRKGVVQKATSKTGTIFTADSETLREQIKARQRAEKHEHDDLNWSPYTEPGYPLLEGEETESIDPRVSSVAVTPKTNTQPKPVIKSTSKISELQTETEQEKIEQAADELEAAVAQTLEPEPVQTEPPTKETVGSTVTPDDELVEAVVEPEPIEDFEVEDDGEETPEWHIEDVSLKDTNTLAMLVVGLVLGVGFIGFMMYSIFGTNSGADVTEQMAPEISLYADTTLQSITLTDLTFNEIRTAINSAVVANQTADTQEYRFVNTVAETVEPATMMDLLRTVSDDGFANVVTTIRFITTDSNERALLLQSTDGVSTLGGMLNWEDTLLADIGPLLDISNVPPSAGSYEDVQLASLDVRALTFDTQILLVYAIINETDVLIATDSAVLRNYVER